jgi:hemolysin III
MTTWRAKDPVSSYSHLAGVLLSIAALVVLVVASDGEPWRTVGFSIYGASLVLLYTASTVYHWLHLSPRGDDLLQRADHVAIFLLIAGSYTPICLVTLRGGWGWSVLGVIWTLAIAGTVLKLCFAHLPRGLSTALYVGMGWVAVVAIGPLVDRVALDGVAWLAAGGLLYTLGAVIYAVEWPNLLEDVVGHHEIFHFCVLGGSIAHFGFMLGWVLPGA